MIQDYVDDPESISKLYKALIAYLVLEGIYFTGEFAYFHSLVRTNRMIGSIIMINLIKEDETQYSVLYGTILQIIMFEFPELNTKENMDFAVEYIKRSVEKEKEKEKEKEWAN
ncbi:ribonucleotide-diphosphate reductase subunit beta [Brevibacillus borstelensis]|uniref:ribonucleotide-diphosphate reductase subunit beta n=2 Tax=Brevibacillus borstelensis TaxID=45462 RepID=UPI002E1E216D|nr:ribonucleotide-diphosphate reductase subunit beta [Brevibacillus borstelensis]